jgi:hypothetical protein
MITRRILVPLARDIYLISSRRRVKIMLVTILREYALRKGNWHQQNAVKAEEGMIVCIFIERVALARDQCAIHSV